MENGDGVARYQPLATPTPINKRPEQARWADAMKIALAHARISLPALTAAVSGELGLSDHTEKIRRWLNNETALEPHAIAPLARAAGVHPLKMLAAYGLVEQSVASLALRLATSERRLRLARAALASQHRSSGGALFAEIALRDGGWAVTVVPHWRGRRCRYHFADYVLLDRRDGIANRGEAHRVFAEAFEKTSAEWDDAPFAGEPSGEWKQGRLYVPRLAAARAPEPRATVLDNTAGVVIAGPRWAGMYTVAALVAEALGWGRESFEMLARSLNPGGGPSVLLADELLRGWLAERSDNHSLVWAHILTDHANDGTGTAGQPASDVRLLANAPRDVQVALIFPEDAGPGSGLHVAAELGGTTPAKLRASVALWRAAIPERPGVAHLTVPTPVDRSGRPVSHRDSGFLDGYFDSGVDVALQVLRRLAGDRPLSDLVPAAAAARDPFAALARSS